MYEYANEFVNHGHDVCLYHVATIEGCKYNIPHWLRMIRTLIVYPDSRPKWYELDQRIKTINIPKIDKQYIRSADFNMLTMWAEVAEFAKIGDSIGKRINLIQAYETWIGDVEKVNDSFKTGAYNIVISGFLADLVERITGSRPPILRNSISKTFCKVINQEKRNAARVAMLYSIHPYKGIEFGLSALKLAKKEVPELYVDLFGIFDAPHNLPEWIIYHKEPKNLCDIYNSASIYLSSSVNDGWDLPCTEAMRCGCAVVCTDIAGHKEYAREGDTAFLAPAEDAQALSNRIVEAIQNNELRFKIAKNGEIEAQKYTMDVAYNQLLQLLAEL